jgi:hypothetical protein
MLRPINLKFSSLALGILFASIPAFAQDHPQLKEPLFQQRYHSFIERAYDPLTVPIDWLKLGILILGEGKYQDQQIVPARWIEEMTHAARLGHTFKRSGHCEGRKKLAIKLG